jgi:multiple sugar transport system substrate-binding protein
MSLQPGLSRRSLLKSGLAVAGLGLGGASLVGCSSDNVASGLTVSRRDTNSVDFWNLFGGGDGIRMTQMEDGYKKAHPSIGLTAVTLAWGNPYYTKLSLATLGDKPLPACWRSCPSTRCRRSASPRTS